jgi:hypothetical protein
VRPTDAAQTAVLLKAVQKGDWDAARAAIEAGGDANVAIKTA